MKKAIAHCHYCGKELYDGDDCLTYNVSDFWCMDCYKDFTRYYQEKITDNYAVRLADYDMTGEIGF